MIEWMQAGGRKQGRSGPLQPPIRLLPASLKASLYLHPAVAGGHVLIELLIEAPGRGEEQEEEGGGGGGGGSLFLGRAMSHENGRRVPVKMLIGSRVGHCLFNEFPDSFFYVNMARRQLEWAELVEAE